MRTFLRTAGVRFWKSTEGQDMVEYALMAAAMAVTAFAFLPNSVIPIVSNTFSSIVSVLQASIAAS